METVMKIYVIVSRDKGVIVATTNPSKVEELIQNQITLEEMAGGRPSVYSVESELVD